MRRFVAIALLTASCHSVHAHGIAGNRFFPGTLTMDDMAGSKGPTLIFRTA